LKIAVYSRKSKFTGKGESIENQIELCKKYILENIPDAIEKDIIVYEDEGYSGKSTDRPEFQKMMKSAKQQKFDYIVCYRLDRISRNVGDFATLLNELTSKGTEFICIKERFDTSNAMGRAMMQIASVFAQLERETIAERVKDNMYMLARTGRWLGGMTPLGFKSEKEERISIDGKSRSSYKLIPVKDEIEIVKIIYSKIIELGSISGVVKYLAQNNIYTRSNKGFSSVAIKDILRNPAYCIVDEDSYNYFFEKGSNISFEKAECDNKSAFMVYNKTKQDDGQTKNDSSDWIVALGKHDGIIKSEKWIKVQILLDGKKKKATLAVRSPHKSPALLSGLLRCGNCGSFMRPHVNSGRKDSEGRTPYYYVCECKDRFTTAKCNMKNLNGYIIDSIICDELLNYDFANSQIAKSLDILAEKVSKFKSTEIQNQDFLENQLKNKKDMIKNLIITLSKGEQDDFAIECIKEQINELGEQCKELEMQIAKASVSASDYTDCNLQVEVVRNALANFKKTFDNASAVEKRNLMRQVIDKIVWDGENANIFILGEQS